MGRWKLQTSIAMVLEQLAVALGRSHVTAVLYYLGNFPDVFPYLAAFSVAGSFFLHLVFSSCMVP